MRFVFRFSRNVGTQRSSVISRAMKSAGMAPGVGGPPSPGRGSGTGRRTAPLCGPLQNEGGTWTALLSECSALLSSIISVRFPVGKEESAAGPPPPKGRPAPEGRKTGQKVEIVQKVLKKGRNGEKAYNISTFLEKMRGERRMKWEGNKKKRKIPLAFLDKFT